VMIGVFAVFGTLSALEFKQMGVGLAAAVLIDATIIRAVLLPASMKLLGDWNWYLPRWLEWLPKVAQEPAAAPAAEEAPAVEGLAIDVDEHDRSLRLKLVGELDRATVGQLRASLQVVEAARPELLVIDLRGLSFMDSMGLREIAEAVRRGRQAGRRVVLVKGSRPVDSVLAMTRAEEMMETVEDPAAVGFADPN
jgi:anti-anti-sigma factor